MSPSLWVAMTIPLAGVINWMVNYRDNAALRKRCRTAQLRST
jgi:hypothetical protein